LEKRQTAQLPLAEQFTESRFCAPIGERNRVIQMTPRFFAGRKNTDFLPLSTLCHCPKI
jgi:hypothetical protein